MSIYEKLMNIQSKLKAPKNQRNNFGNYNYRSCEDILEALKPLMAEQKAFLTINDETLLVGDRYYIKATAKITDAENPVQSIEVSALAREDETKKGMDLAQVTGSTSSYARKYALNGLFCIDDTKDSDATNDHGKGNESHEKAHTGTKNDNKTNTPIYEPIALCSGCGKPITEAENNWSIKNYKKCLCKACQKKHPKAVS